MKLQSMARLALVAAGLLSAAQAAAQGGGSSAANDPRVGLTAGWNNAGVAGRSMELVSNTQRPAGFFDPADSGNFSFAVSDMAFRGNLLFAGGYHGLQVYDISNPDAPRVRSTLACPGGQGDVSVYGNLLFYSVEETRGRLDCGGQGVQDTVSAERFRGVRIFDITNIDAPRQVASVQTCRGSHTHTLVPDPRDAGTIYVYVQGTSVARSPSELAGCVRSPQDTASAYFRIEVIRVPLANPQQARVVNAPRIFADPQTGNIAGLWQGGSHGQGTQTTSQTNQCHDITVYPQVGLAAGACSGNGILLDIRDPANPRRVEEVTDPNFAYWHSATFNNDASTVIFTDEWGGGAGPRCRATDPPLWGSNAIFTLNNRELRPAGHYKLPAPQTAQENCVAHNGSLVPVPGRDIMVQAWYQGGISVFDFTDPAKPVEIAFFDRGPMAESLVLGGYWSAYWYNGLIYGTEINRGIDVLRLAPSMHLSHNELEAAKLVRMEQWNPQMQTRIEWPAAFVVSRAYLDQLVRSRGVSTAAIARIAEELNRAEAMGAGAERRSALNRLAGYVDGQARGADARRVRALAASVRALARAGS
jgi:hypothetical protein